MKRKENFWIGLCAFTIIAAWSTVGSSVMAQSGGDHPSANAEISSVHPGMRTLDDQLVEVANNFPGFGGMFFDENGDLNVYLAGAAAVEHRKAPDIWNEKARAALTRVFGEGLFKRGVSAHRDVQNQADRKTARVKIREGKHDMRKLVKWRPSVEHALTIEGVVFTDLDEANNRLKVGIEFESLRDVVETELRRQGVPPDVVIIEVTEAIAPLATLRDYVRPTEGGLQVQTTQYNCTLGFNAYKSYNNGGFVTCSHCTDNQGGVESTRFYQNDTYPSTNYIGYEYLDPPYFTSIWPWECPWGRRCRYSDAAWIRNASGVSWGFREITRPVSWNRGSLTISSSSPSMTIVSETATPLSGEMLDKVGRTTGWTYGYVSNTCTTVNALGTNITLKCQNIVNRYSGQTHSMSGPGDSGSPVFKWYGSTVSLHGILWGGAADNFVFSSMKYIEQELGSLYTYSVPSPPPPPGSCPSGQKCCEPAPNGGCYICIPPGAYCP